MMISEEPSTLEISTFSSPIKFQMAVKDIRNGSTELLLLIFGMKYWDLSKIECISSGENPLEIKY